MKATAIAARAPSPMRTRDVAAWLGLVVLGSLAGCDRVAGGSTTQRASLGAPGTDTLTAIPLGDVAGAAKSSMAENAANPYEGNPQAVEEGHTLFIRMNCAGCHGYDAKGGMGPNLTDTYWRYGGVPAQIFKSIYEGRPQGMPAWNPALPPDQIWKLVSYVESLGGSMPPQAYQALLQGDRPGDNVPPGVDRTLPEGVMANAATQPANAASTATPTTEARPDAGGNPPTGTSGGKGAGGGH